MAQSTAKAFGLDTSETRIEKIPMVVSPASDIKLKRVIKERFYKKYPDESK